MCIDLINHHDLAAGDSLLGLAFLLTNPCCVSELWSQYTHLKCNSMKVGDSLLVFFSAFISKNCFSEQIVKL